MRPDSYPREPTSDPLRAPIRAIHADTQHGIVVPGTVLSHAVIHAEDPALARITNMRSTIDEHSQRAALLNVPSSLSPWLETVMCARLGRCAHLALPRRCRILAAGNLENSIGRSPRRPTALARSVRRPREVACCRPPTPSSAMSTPHWAPTVIGRRPRYEQPRSAHPPRASVVQQNPAQQDGSNARIMVVEKCIRR